MIWVTGPHSGARIPTSMWAIFAGATGSQRIVSLARTQKEIPRHGVTFAENSGKLNKRCFVNHVFSDLRVSPLDDRSSDRRFELRRYRGLSNIRCQFRQSDASPRQEISARELKHEKELVLGKLRPIVGR